MQIIRITDPAICNYKVEIGSWLLCGDNYVEA